MKQIFNICLLTCILLCFNVIISAQSDVPAQRDVQELKNIYSELDSATRKLDSRAVEKYLAENYKLEAEEEKLDKRETLVRLKKHFSTVASIIEAVSTVEKVLVVENNYVLEVTNFTKGTVKTPDGRMLEFSVTTKSTDIWKRDRFGNWRQNTQFYRDYIIAADNKDLIAE